MEALFLAACGLGGVAEFGCTARPVSRVHVAVALVLWAAVAARRARPFAATAFAFGLLTLLNVAEALHLLPKLELGSGAWVLLIPYALLRRGTGREVVLGTPLVLVTYLAALAGGALRKWEDVIGSAVVLALPVAIGAAVRSTALARESEVAHARSRERERLARELHDTVAHHVTAILIQAQAGRAIAAQRAEALPGVLSAIEGEAQRALGELRELVGALRDADADGDAPSHGLDRLRALARLGPPEVTVELDDALGDARPVLAAALYRLAQESVTNALKHARHASRVLVTATLTGDGAELRVVDDGTPAAAPGGKGFGLIGMAERVHLLGGRFSAGPRAGGGWEVHAMLPNKP